MPYMPRALVLTPVLDVKSMIAALDKILVGFSGVSLSAQIRNTATVTRESRLWLLFPFLDKGTKPHWIGEADDLLGSKGREFGPVWGPVLHPGTRPYDISARVAAQLQSLLESRVRFPVLHFAGIKSKSPEVPWENLRRVMVDILLSTVKFAERITPDNWRQVKQSYELWISGRRVQ